MRRLLLMRWADAHQRLRTESNAFVRGCVHRALWAELQSGRGLPGAADPLHQASGGVSTAPHPSGSHSACCRPQASALQNYRTLVEQRGSKHGSYLIMSARCGEKHTMENRTLTRYKNSHPYCPSLNISSENLFRWKDKPCSQPALWLDDETPINIYQQARGEGLETVPGTVPLGMRQLPGMSQAAQRPARGLWEISEGQTHTLSNASGLGVSLRQGSEVDFGSPRSLFKRIQCVLAGSEALKEPILPPPVLVPPELGSLVTKQDEGSLSRWLVGQEALSHARKIKLSCVSLFLQPCSRISFSVTLPPPYFPSQHSPGTG